MNAENNSTQIKNIFDFPAFTFVAGEVAESILDFELMENIMEGSA